MNRRAFVVGAGASLGVGVFGGACATTAERPASREAQTLVPGDWASVRAQFELAKDRTHLALFFLASLPRPVRDAIERHRRGFDADPVTYFQETIPQAEAANERAAAEYLGVAGSEIAFTDSTTMGLGLLYGGFKLAPGDEVLTTTHDHYSTAESFVLRQRRDGIRVNQVSLYDDPAEATEAEIVARLTAAVTPQTRLVAVTWVHSGTGVKLPIRAIADALKTLNQQRADRPIRLAVDGVHGFGADEARVSELGCDFFIAGCHKWLMGPRGTGILWGSKEAWRDAQPVIPHFGYHAFEVWEGKLASYDFPMATLMTPGGFHSFEYRWALADAFHFQKSLGRKAVAERIRALNTQFKEGARSIPRLRLRTPTSPALSCGINCFEIDGLSAEEIVGRMKQKGFVTSVTPYRVRYARTSFGILNTEDEVERSLAALREIAA